MAVKPKHGATVVDIKDVQGACPPATEIAAIREAIINDLHAAKIYSPIDDRIAQQAIGLIPLYIADKALDKSAPTRQQVNTALQQISKAANRLHRLLANADDVTRMIIQKRSSEQLENPNENLARRSGDQFQSALVLLARYDLRSLTDALQALAIITEEKADVPIGCEYAKVLLCKRLARVLIEHTGEYPRTTPGKPLGDIASILAGAVDGGEPDMFRASLQAVKEIGEEPPQ